MMIYSLFSERQPGRAKQPYEKNLSISNFILTAGNCKTIGELEGKAILTLFCMLTVFVNNCFRTMNVLVVIITKYHLSCLEFVHHSEAMVCCWANERNFQRLKQRSESTWQQFLTTQPFKFSCLLEIFWAFN